MTVVVNEVNMTKVNVKHNFVESDTVKTLNPRGH